MVPWCYSILRKRNVCIGKSFFEEVNYADVVNGRDERNFIIQKDFLIKRNDEYKFSENIEESWIGVDIGPETIKMLQELIKKSRSIFWNGPPGIFEDEKCTGTEKIVKLLEEAEKNGKYVLVGGGETACAARKLGHISNVSTGGGALLSLLEGSDMPGIRALEKED